MSWSFHRRGFVRSAAGPLAGRVLSGASIVGYHDVQCQCTGYLRGLECVINAFLLLLKLFISCRVRMLSQK